MIPTSSSLAGPMRFGQSADGVGKGGFKLSNYFAAPLFAAYKTIEDELAHLKDIGSPAMSYNVFAPSEKEIQDVCGLRKYVEIENVTTVMA